MYYSNERKELQLLVPPHTQSLLDVGCGTGAFASKIKEKLACEVWGVEPVSSAAQEAAKLIDKTFVGLYDTQMISDIQRQFDAICFNDVLEHMPDPYTILQASKQLLKPDGVIIASLPNILHYHEFSNILFKKDFRYAEAGIMDKTHLRFFTRKSIIRMFEEAGLRIEKVVGLDPTPSKKMSLISLLSFGYFSEMRYPQFAVIAKL